MKFFFLFSFLIFISIQEPTFFNFFRHYFNYHSCSLYSIITVHNDHLTAVISIQNSVIRTYECHFVNVVIERNLDFFFFFQKKKRGDHSWSKMDWIFLGTHDGPTWPIPFLLKLPKGSYICNCHRYKKVNVGF